MSIPFNYAKVYLFQDEFKRIFYEDEFWKRQKTKEYLNDDDLEKMYKRKFAEFTFLIHNAYYFKNAHCLLILHESFKRYHDLLFLIKNS